jgi:predicted O-methyltransferase YrrM
MKLCPCRLEAARDPRPTHELLGTLPCLADGDLTRPWWSSDRYYQFYAALGQLLAPVAVLEVGVRLGYSLIALLRGHPAIARIVGLDNQSDVAGSQKWAEDNLRAAGYKGALALPMCDTSGITPRHWPLHRSEEFGLVHVDGDHSYAGTLSAFLASWPHLAPGGVIVIDDCKAVHVREAVESVRMALSGLAWDFYFPTFTGWWVGVKADD